MAKGPAGAAETGSEYKLDQINNKRQKGIIKKSYLQNPNLILFVLMYTDYIYTSRKVDN